ncbi:J domain-containing protein [Candidatus Peregrinibacteria bacterium]|nr:J domain-containing protein [Candidatus Peregrinibacteria bacterium]
MALKNFYEILGVPETASPSEIKQGYFAMAKKYHPDAGDEAEVRQFYEVTEAYEILSDKEKRRAYDLTLAEGKTKSTSVPGEPSAEKTELKTSLYANFRRKEARRFRNTVLWQGILRVIFFPLVAFLVVYAVASVFGGMALLPALAALLISFVYSMRKNFDISSFGRSAFSLKLIKMAGWGMLVIGLGLMAWYGVGFLTNS